MPDKDYIHTKINQYFYNLADAFRSDSYRSKFPEVMNRSMKKYAVAYGDDVIRLVSEIEKKLKPATEATPLELQNVQWNSIVSNIERTIQRDKAPKRIKGIVGDCTEKMINRMKRGWAIDEPGYYLVDRFLWRGYEADFKEPIKEKFSSNKTLDRLEEFGKVEEELRPYYVNQIINKDDAKKIRKKPLKRRPKLDLDEEIG